ncbi:hypothetical protein RRF57_011517 [Xylaria bambusicola]|uniref:Uncharacterized protein n=1 Tax=Xylaria bambusicola TaxID=326684 RepID=A0AAN7UMZ2_9PEZI
MGSPTIKRYCERLAILLGLRDEVKSIQPRSLDFDSLTVKRFSERLTKTVLGTKDQINNALSEIDALKFKRYSERLAKLVCANDGNEGRESDESDIDPLTFKHYSDHLAKLCCTSDENDGEDSDVSEIDSLTFKRYPDSLPIFRYTSDDDYSVESAF